MFTPFRLKKPIGEEFNMDFDDALNTKRALVHLGHMEMPDYGIDEYPDRPMLDGVKSFQREQDLTEDGVMKPDGPTLERLNETLVARQKKTRPPTPVLAGPKPAPSRLPVGSINLKLPITSRSEVNLEGAGRIKKALNKLRLLDIRTHGLNEFPDEQMFDGVKAFERQQGLEVDKERQPDGDIIKRLKNVLQKQSKIEQSPKKDHDQVELAFAPAVPIGIAFAEWLMGVLPAATVAAAMAVFAASSKPRQQELRKQYQEETGNDDDAEDHCHQRWMDERDACYFRAPEWQGKCKERARYRFTLCRENGGVPDPNEPPEWSKADEVVSFNPDR